MGADWLDSLSYSVIFKSTDSRITSDILLPPSQRLDVSTATDMQVVNEVAMCIAQYMKDLLFQKDQFRRYIGSPYDNFLRVNHLQQAPLAGETKAHYNLRLYQQVVALTSPIYITPANGSFKYHNQPYQFGPLELQGLKIFLASAIVGVVNAHAGNCAACHQAPDFSDFVFHNNGVSQAEYDAVNGSGAFMNLNIPIMRRASPASISTCPPRRIIPMPARPSVTKLWPAVRNMQTSASGTSTSIRTS